MATRSLRLPVALAVLAAAIAAFVLGWPVRPRSSTPRSPEGAAGAAADQPAPGATGSEVRAAPPAVREGVVRPVRTVEPLGGAATSRLGGSVPPSVRGAEPEPAAAGPSDAYRQRMRETAVLNEARLPAAKVQEIVAFLEAPHTPESGMGLMEYDSIKNDLLDRLIRERPLPERLGFRLVAMCRDRGLDAVWRDYCVQHFAPYYEARWPSASPAVDEPEAAALRQALFDAAGALGGATAGTALIGLERLSRRYPEVDRRRVEAEALRLTASDAVPTGTRTTAVQICAVLGAPGALPAARRLARDGRTVALRLAATAAVGALGGAGERQLLEGLKTEGKSGLEARAAGLALTRLEARLDGGGLP